MRRRVPPRQPFLPGERYPAPGAAKKKAWGSRGPACGDDAGAVASARAAGEAAPAGLPPLRERGDLEVVIHRLLAAEANGEPPTVSPEVMALFKRHNWPGNFRQLTNLLRTAIVMAGSAREVKIEHLPEDFLDDVGQFPASSDIVLQGPAKADLAQGNVRLEDVELLTIQKSLDEHRGNVSAAARALGVSRNTIYRKLQK
jgi:transcriptional regulator of acetoin/glycerol metabolism